MYSSKLNKFKLLAFLFCFTLTGCSFIPVSRNINEPFVFDEMDAADQTHYQLALHYIESHHYDAAQEKLISLISRYPFFADLYNSQGVLFERRGQLTKAKKSFLKAIKLNLNHYVALENYGMLLCYRENDVLNLELDDFFGDKKLLSRLYSAASKCYISRNNFDLAQKKAEQAILLDGEFALSYLYVAKTYYYNQLYNKANLALDRFNDLNGYSQESAQLGLNISAELKNREDVLKYQYILKTQFNEESSEE